MFNKKGKVRHWDVHRDFLYAEKYNLDQLMVKHTYEDIKTGLLIPYQALIGKYFKDHNGYYYLEAINFEESEVLVYSGKKHASDCNRSDCAFKDKCRLPGHECYDLQRFVKFHESCSELEGMVGVWQKKR
jgi:hypothetical protein